MTEQKQAIEEAKEYLRSYGEKIKRVERYEQLLTYAKADLEHPRLTIAGKDIGGGRSGNISDATATPVLKMLDIEEKYNNAVRESNACAEHLSRLISKMPETDGKTYLIEIYLLLAPIKMVCYSSKKGIRQFYEAYNNALLDFFAVWKEKENKRN